MPLVQKPREHNYISLLALDHFSAVAFAGRMSQEDSELCIVYPLCSPASFWGTTSHTVLSILSSLYFVPTSSHIAAVAKSLL